MEDVLKLGRTRKEVVEYLNWRNALIINNDKVESRYIIKAYTHNINSVKQYYEISFDSNNISIIVETKILTSVAPYDEVKKAIPGVYDVISTTHNRLDSLFECAKENIYIADENTHTFIKYLPIKG